MERKNGSGVDEREEENTLQQEEGDSANAMLLHQDTDQEVKSQGEERKEMKEAGSSSGTKTDDNEENVVQNDTSSPASVHASNTSTSGPELEENATHISGSSPQNLDTASSIENHGTSTDENRDSLPSDANPNLQRQLQLNRGASGGGPTNLQVIIIHGRRMNFLLPPLNRITYRLEYLGLLGNEEQTDLNLGLSLPPTPLHIHNTVGNMSLLPLSRDPQFVPQTQRQVINFFILITRVGDQPIVLNVILVTRVANELEIHHFIADF